LETENGMGYGGIRAVQGPRARVQLELKQ
jgi:hypothetical protein